MRFNSNLGVNAGIIGSLATLIKQMQYIGSYYSASKKTAKIAGSAYRTVKGAMGYRKVSNKGVRSTHFTTQRSKVVGRRKYRKGKQKKTRSAALISKSQRGKVKENCVP